MFYLASEKTPSLKMAIQTLAQFRFEVLLLVIASILVISAILPKVVFFMLLAFWAVLILLKRAKTFIWQLLLWFLAIGLGIFIGTYRPEDFTYPVLFTVNSLHDGGAPYTLAPNLGKALAAYGIAIVFWHFLNKGHGLFVTKGRLWFSLSLIFLPAIFINLLALFAFDLYWVLKPVEYIVLFCLANLLTTCVAEELFMRGLLQQRLLQWFDAIPLPRSAPKKLLLEGSAILICTLVFLLTHAVSGGASLLVYGVAGGAYALIYSLTKRLEFAILLHFFVNAIHFAFLPYPLN